MERRAGGEGVLASVIDFKEIANGDDWELFARDFFSALGFVIETDPSRGADGGKDFIISEQVSGKLHTKKFTWLVSCKHNAISGKSVSTADEPDIKERLDQHECDGFMGFYSTMASTGLMSRLGGLSIQDYTIYDGMKISGHFYNTGFSRLALRFFPVSYSKLRPLQLIVSDHIELNCEICGCDWIKKIIDNPQMGIIVYAKSIAPDKDTDVENLYITCKGYCDRTLEERLYANGFITSWEDIEDLCNPLGFLKDIMSYMNILHEGRKKISKEAHDRQKEIYIALAQRVLREVSDDDKKRMSELNLFNIV